MKIRCKGIANKSARDEVLDVYFYEIEFDGEQISNGIGDPKNNSQETIELNWNQNDLDKEIGSVIDAYLKLHLLSNKCVLPNSINLMDNTNSISKNYGTLSRCFQVMRMFHLVQFILDLLQQAIQRKRYH